MTHQSQGGDHFIFKRHGVWSSREGIVIGKNVMYVSPKTIESINMSVEEAQKIVASMTPGTLHLLHEGGGSLRFLRALQLVGLVP